MKLHSKSPAAYAMLKESRIIVLPSRQRLSMERNLFKPKSGIQSNTLSDMGAVACQTKILFERNVILIIDEMKITGTVNFLWR